MFLQFRGTTRHQFFGWLVTTKLLVKQNRALDLYVKRIN